MSERPKSLQDVLTIINNGCSIKRTHERALYQIHTNGGELICCSMSSSSAIEGALDKIRRVRELSGTCKGNYLSEGEWSKHLEQACNDYRMEHYPGRGRTPMSNWISVEDQPRPMDREHLVYLSEDMMGTRIHSSTGVVVGGVFNHDLEWAEITHWMEMPPAPPKPLAIACSCGSHNVTFRSEEINCGAYYIDIVTCNNCGTEWSEID